MLIFIAALIGGLIGFFTARRKGLSIYDQLHRATVLAILFLLAALICDVILGWQLS